MHPRMLQVSFICLTCTHYVDRISCLMGSLTVGTAWRVWDQRQLSLDDNYPLFSLHQYTRHSRP